MHDLDEATTPTTEDKEAISSMVAAARADGLVPVVQGRGVDLRVMDGPRVVAAIRMRLVEVLGDVRWVYEYPARAGAGEAPTGMRLRSPFGSASTPVQRGHLRDLDYWWARIPATGRTWRWRAPEWTRRRCSRAG